MGNTMRQDRTAVSVYQGIIKLIELDGSIVEYAQRGIRRLSRQVLNEQIYKGALSTRALTLQELPKDYSIHFEVRGMGRAVANYKVV